MSKLMIKLKAYTVMEVIVVMIISAIVISICYTSFDIISSQYRTYKEHNEKVNRSLLLDVLLNKDFNACEAVKITDEGFECAYRGKKIYYEISETKLIRMEEQVTDTFAVSSGTITFGFLGKEVSTPGAFVSSLSFTTLEKEMEQHYFYSKEYGADFLMEIERLNK